MKSTCCINETIRLTPADAPRDIHLYFELDEDMERLWIDTAYFPQYLYNCRENVALFQQCIERYALDPRTDTYGTLGENIPFANMVVLSVDREGRHVGNVHRNLAAQHLLISANEASPGFLRQAPARGRWHVAVHVFRIVTPCCEFRIAVHGTHAEGAYEMESL